MTSSLLSLVPFLAAVSFSCAVPVPSSLATGMVLISAPPGSVLVLLPHLGGNFDLKVPSPDILIFLI